MALDLKKISFSELAGIVNAFPWFGAARKELALRSGRGADAAFYVCSRRLLKDESYNIETVPAISKVISQAPEQKVVVLGGDFFSQEQYDAVREEEDNIFSSFVKSEKKFEGALRGEKDADFMDLCTETLAKVYAQQGYTEQAKYIYSKLILRYPEKNAYFAALIEKLGQPEN